MDKRPQYAGPCKHYYQEIFTGDLEKELGTGTRLYIGNTQMWQKWFKWQMGQNRYFGHPAQES